MRKYYTNEAWKKKKTNSGIDSYVLNYFHLQLLIQSMENNFFLKPKNKNDFSTLTEK